MLAAAPPKRVALAAGDDDSRPLAVSLKQGSGDIFVFGAPHDPTDQAAPDSPHTPLAAAAAAALSKLLTDQPAVAPAAAPTTPPSDAPAPTTAAASAYDSANTSGAAAPAAADEAALLASLAALWADEDRRERRRRSCAQHGGGASGSGSGDDEGDHSGGEETPLSCGELQLLNLLLRPDPAEGDTVTGLGGPQGDGVQLRPLWSMGLLPRTISGVRAKLRAKRHGCGSAACREAEPGVGAGARFGEAVMGEGRQDGEEQHQGEGVEEGEEGDEGGGPCLGCCAAAAAAAAPARAAAAHNHHRVVGRGRGARARGGRHNHHQKQQLSCAGAVTGMSWCSCQPKQQVQQQHAAGHAQQLQFSGPEQAVDMFGGCGMHPALQDECDEMAL